MTLKTVWENSQKTIKEKIGSASYETWFTSIQIKEISPQTLSLEAPYDFFKNWIIEHYQAMLEEILSAAASFAVNLEFKVNPAVLEDAPREQPSIFQKEYNSFTNDTSNLNSRFTFDNFVIGPSNRFACAASFAVAESPAKAYNPLFIYGQVGLGKTHLIQAISQKILEINSKLKICYRSSEQFTNELIDAIRHRSTPEFRKKYREIDVLLIDDIQFIAGKDSTQEEFFHTFNNLHNNRKQLIITSDRPPKEIARLEERLSSRFAWGLIADIQPPDYETRVAILRKKVENEPLSVPDEVIHYIADKIKTNIRELEGALIRVTAYSLLEEKLINLDMARNILKDMIKETAKIISVEMVQKIVSERFNVSLNELKSNKRTKNIVLPRQIAMYLARQLTNLSLPEIGGAFGGKDHTTVLHSCKKIAKDLESNSNLKDSINGLFFDLQQ
ncbi:MAG: chromosomal replication initiator protein DnaA [Candidatus Omnitrophica bacterium]|nr:chromosomal replication initiator protein DnaA [Candidatus Omnitrophota bacterium]